MAQRRRSAKAVVGSRHAISRFLLGVRASTLKGSAGRVIWRVFAATSNARN